MNRSHFDKLTDAANLAISHVIEYGCDDVFRLPHYSHSIEESIIRKRPECFKKFAYKEVIKFLKCRNLENCRIGHVQTALTVKDTATFRRVCWLDPIDAVKYLAVAILLFPKIEEKRLPRTANILHSHRAGTTPSTLFDRNYGYSSFRTSAGELIRANQGGYLVTTDIANFYDRIGNHSLENHLLDIGCDREIVTLLREILLFWSGDRRSFGVPVGSDASRVISEAVLIDIDRHLHDEGVNFVRYVDDYRIVASDKGAAHRAIQVLTEMLCDEGLALNSAKTSVRPIIGESAFREEITDQHLTEHEKIDTSRVVETRVPLRVSGRTAYSKRYDRPGERALSALRSLDKTQFLQELNASSNSDEEILIRRVVKFFIYVDQDAELLRMLLAHKITAVFYIVDALLKEEEKFDEETARAIVGEMKKALNWERMAYPFQLPILRLFSSQKFCDDEFTRGLFDRQTVGDNHVFFREIIAVSGGCLDRQRLRKLAIEIFPALPRSTKRAVYLSVRDHEVLSADEKRPLLRNMRQSEDDWFVVAMAKEHDLRVSDPKSGSGTAASAGSGGR
jgi:hypothetical protein